MTEIILVRHGETTLNAAGIFRGTIDVGLNKTGFKQAALLGEYLRDTKIVAVYSSPLKRAIMTAEAIAGFHRLPVETLSGLIDLNFGEWQGLSRQEVKGKYSELYDEWLNRPDSVQMPGGENLKDIRKRAAEAMNRAVAAHQGTVVLSSHRVVHKVLICYLLGLDNSHFWNIALDTCGISIFTVENDRFILTRHNDISFLKPLSFTKLGDF